MYFWTLTLVSQKNRTTVICEQTLKAFTDYEFSDFLASGRSKEIFEKIVIARLVLCFIFEKFTVQKFVALKARLSEYKISLKNNLGQMFNCGEKPG